jgi:hypothetical protein
MEQAFGRTYSSNGGDRCEVSAVEGGRVVRGCDTRARRTLGVSAFRGTPDRDRRHRQRSRGAREGRGQARAVRGSRDMREGQLPRNRGFDRPPALRRIPARSRIVVVPAFRFESGLQLPAGRSSRYDYGGRGAVRSGASRLCGRTGNRQDHQDLRRGAKVQNDRTGDRARKSEEPDRAYHALAGCNRAIRPCQGRDGDTLEVFPGAAHMGEQRTGKPRGVPPPGGRTAEPGRTNRRDKLPVARGSHHQAVHAKGGEGVYLPAGFSPMPVRACATAENSDSANEVERNPRSRSAKLRAAERV